MVDVKISAAADAGGLLSDDMLPLARSGSTTAFHATLLEIQGYTNTTPGAAASSSLQLTTGDASGGDSGAIILQTGAATGTRGNIILDAPVVASPSGQDLNLAAPGGGGAWLYSDDTTGATASGYAGVVSGYTASANSGPVMMGSGDSSAANSGWVTLYTGNGLATGDITLGSGNASAGNSGAITLLPGSATGTRGAINLSAPQVLLLNDPTAALGAATKQYVDSIAAGLPLTGGTLTGSLALSPGVIGAGAKVATLFAGLNIALNQQGNVSFNTYQNASNQWVSIAGGGVNYLTSNAGILSLWGAGSSTAGNTVIPTQILQASTLGITMASGTDITLNRAPTSNLHAATKQYVDTAAAPAAGSVGRNLLHNAMFNIAQRGAGPWTATGYTLDRWAAGITTDTASFSQVGGSDADRTAIGDEAAYSLLQNVFTGNAAAGAFHQIVQRIENVRRLTNKSVTVSFWAKAAAGTPKLGLNILQSFGTGGSPSAQVRALATGNAVTLSTSWARYTSTIAIPSASGKTLGTNGDHSTALEIWFSSGSTNNAVAGNIGVQSGTIQLWGVQLEIGSVATALEKLDPRLDLAHCQRFYFTATVFATGYGGAAGNTIYGPYFYPVPMRASPTIAYSGQSYVNASALATYQSYNNSYVVQGTASAAGTAIAAGTMTASADL